MSKPIIILSLIAGSLTPLLTPFMMHGAVPERITLDNSILPIPATARSSRAVNPRTPIEFQIALKMRNQADLEARVAKGETLSEADMVAKYYPLAADYTLLLTWLKRQKLTIQETFSNRLTVIVSGSVDQVRQALNSEFTSVSIKGKIYTAARTAPSLPSNLARFVVGVNGLQPYQRVYPLHTTLKRTGRNLLPYSVQDIKKAYNADGLNVDGTGQTIAILIDNFPLDSDLQAFWTQNKVPQSLKNIQRIPVVKTIPPGVIVESTLDVTWSSSIAPKAKIRIYGTGDLSSANLTRGFQRMLVNLHNQRTFNQLSISLGGCEAEIPDSQKITENLLLTAIASAGVSIFAGAGNRGSQGYCFKTNQSGVSYFASYPSVTGVGGTALLLNRDSSTIKSEIGWFSGGGGNSTFFSRPRWQVGPGIQPGKTRLVPDVSLNADSPPGYSLIVGGFSGAIGGTSAATPVWAGFSALINQARVAQGKPVLGFLNPRIYKLIGTRSFRDITRGDNGKFQAAKGYDRVTGVGVPVVDQLLPALVKEP